MIYDAFFGARPRPRRLSKAKQAKGSLSSVESSESRWVLEAGARMDAASFNQPLNWNVSNVTDTRYMFEYAHSRSKGDIRRFIRFMRKESCGAEPKKGIPRSQYSELEKGIYLN